MDTVQCKKYIRKITDYIFLFLLGVPHLVSGIALITFFGANRFGKVLQPLGIDFVYTPAGVVMAQFFVNPLSIERYRRFANRNERLRYGNFYCGAQCAYDAS